MEERFLTLGVMFWEAVVVSELDIMFYTRGSEDDFNRWADVTGDSGWSWNSILPYFLKGSQNEKWTPPADHHDTTGEFNPVFHSTTGLTETSLPGFSLSIDSRVLQTTQVFPNEFPFNEDYNGGKPIGLGWVQSTIGNGTRSSSATSYLSTPFISRRNLDVVLNVRVTRVLQTQSNGTLSIRTIEVLNGSQRQNFTATKEVILSAGSIGTPGILLHSGIGDETVLKPLGISPVLNLPSVGRNLTDQPLSTIAWTSSSTDPFEPPILENNATLLSQSLQQWMTTRTGPLASQALNHVAWKRLDNTSILSQFGDPSAGPNTPHLEFIFTNGGGADFPSGHFVGGGFIVVTPTSRGSVTISSNNPLDAPTIDPAFLSTEFDILAFREALLTTVAFFSTQPWKDFILSPVQPFPNISDINSIDSLLKESAESSFHPVGTAAMSATNAQFGVVNPDLRVKNVEGLRIIDASIMPFITSAHTQAPVYAIAERGSDLIKAFWNVL
ncbi:hypothetical protein Clacol_002050 [Clathrus columnatus]|uniref:Glucose-methanol-choline oxidoreductase N-terminal domain-containing protein n=1 Tax=Clathrus columnatus TaxID=1419009 RepID=A0AAV5A0R5_9AGAM|nr:hypothetical protein Clacol_002050 [Clathrus columnatus]